jgi:hypothetical protein
MRGHSDDDDLTRCIDVEDVVFEAGENSLSNLASDWCADLRIFANFANGGFYVVDKSPGDSA